MRCNSASSEKMDFRKFSRLDLAASVEVRTGTLGTIGLTENIGLGGLLLQCSPEFHSGGRIDVLFNLTAGLSIKARCSVAHVQPKARIGLRFLDLDAPSQQILDDFIREIALHMQQRQDKFVVERLHVTVKGSPGGEPHAEVAETLLLTRPGSVLTSR